MRRDGKETILSTPDPSRSEHTATRHAETKTNQAANDEADRVRGRELDFCKGETREDQSRGQRRSLHLVPLTASGKTQDSRGE